MAAVLAWRGAEYGPFGSGFLIFSDYARPAIRLSALMEMPTIHVSRTIQSASAMGRRIADQSRPVAAASNMYACCGQGINEVRKRKVL